MVYTNKGHLLTVMLTDDVQALLETMGWKVVHVKPLKNRLAIIIED